VNVNVELGALNVGRALSCRPGSQLWMELRLMIMVSDAIAACEPRKPMKTYETTNNHTCWSGALCVQMYTRRPSPASGLGSRLR